MQKDGRTSGGRRMLVLASALAGAPALLAGAPQARAQADFPNKALRIVVPFAPGGPSDVLARLLSTSLQEGFRQPVIVDNRAGAGGLLGFEMVIKAPRDGYTLIMAGDSLTVKPSLFARPPFDPVKDFTPVVMLGSTPFVLATPPALPARTMKDLIAMAQAKPGALQFGSAGVGVSSHLSGELLKSVTGIDVLHVPYKGQAPAINALMANEITFMLANPIVVLPLLRADKVRAIAVTGAKRSALLPDVPTVAETVPGFETGTWFALLGPAGLPADITGKLNAGVIRSMGSAETRARMAELGMDAVLGPPEQLGQFVRNDTAKWAKVVKLANVPLE